MHARTSLAMARWSAAQQSEASGEGKGRVAHSARGWRRLVAAAVSQTRAAPNHDDPALFFSFLSILAHAMAARPSVQNSKAHLTQSYNELGRELSSAKIRVVGNYTLGKVIGEGV
jgi:hypothetical protein